MSKLFEEDFARIATAFAASDYAAFELSSGEARVMLKKQRRAPAPEVVTIASPSVGMFERVLGDCASAKPSTVLARIKTAGAQVDVRAGQSGVVRSALVAESDFVEFGQALFTLEPTDGADAAGRGQ